MPHSRSGQGKIEVLIHTSLFATILMSALRPRRDRDVEKYVSRQFRDRDVNSKPRLGLCPWLFIYYLEF